MDMICSMYMYRMPYAVCNAQNFKSEITHNPRFQVPTRQCVFSTF